MTSRTPKTPGAPQDTPVIPADPIESAADPVDDQSSEVDYEAILEKCNVEIAAYQRRINELEAENAQLRDHLFAADTDADTAPTPPSSGMELTANGWVIK